MIQTSASCLAAASNVDGPRHGSSLWNLTGASSLRPLQGAWQLSQRRSSSRFKQLPALRCRSSINPSQLLPQCSKQLLHCRLARSPARKRASVVLFCFQNLNMKTPLSRPAALVVPAAKCRTGLPLISTLPQRDDQGRERVAEVGCGAFRGVVASSFSCQTSSYPPCKPPRVSLSMSKLSTEVLQSRYCLHTAEAAASRSVEPLLAVGSL